MTSAYPQELRTPPLPLVAFIGGAEHHKEIGAFFSHVMRPPMITVGVAERYEQLLAKLFGNRKPIPPALPAPAGIIKTDWFLKHRQRKAAVAIAFVSRHDVEGDPNSWNRMLYQLKTIRDASSGRNAGMVVALTQDAGGAEVPADRIAAICSHLQLEQRCFVVLHRPTASPAPSDRDKVRYEGDLKAMGKLAQELAGEYYRAEAQRRAQKHSVRVAQLGGSCPAEINTRVAFKLAVMAEFQQEWGQGITLYQAAYSHVKEVPLGSPLSYQRHVEVTRVAEQIHFKIMMLLLHQNRYEEAIAQFKTHLSLYLKPPEPLPPVAQAAHLGWAARQFQVAVEMLRSKLESNPNLVPHRECHPAYLQLSAAQASIRRRQAAEAARQNRLATPLTIDVSSVKRGVYVGQVVLRTESGTRDLSDKEYLLYLEAEESKMHHTAVNLDLLSSALMMFKDTRYERMRSQLGVLMAQEHFIGNSLPNARKLLLQICHTYRRDGWNEAVVQVLGQLRECAQRLKNPREYVAFTLEITALPNTLDADTNLNTAKAAVSTLLTGISAIKSSIIKTPSPDRTASSDPSATSPTPSTSSSSSRFDYTIEHLDLKDIQRHARTTQDSRASLSADLLIRHHQQDFGWWRCIALSAGFTPSTPDPPHLDFHLCLRNNLPVALPLKHVEVQFADELGDMLVLCRPGFPEKDAAPSPMQGRGAAALLSPTSSNMSSPIVSPREHSVSELGEQLASTTLEATTSLPATAAASTAGGSSHSSPGWGPAASAAALTLQPGQWQQLYVRVQPRCVGRLRATQVVMVVSDHSTLHWKLDTFPPNQVSLNNLHLQLPNSPFRRFPSVVPGSLSFNVQHVGPLPKLELQVSPSPLVHEHTCVTATVTTSSPLQHAELEFSFKSVDPQIKAEHLTLHVPNLSSSTDILPVPPSDSQTPSQASSQAPSQTPSPRSSDASSSTHHMVSLDSQRIRISDLRPGVPKTFTIYLRSIKEGKVVVTATMFCPMIIHRSVELNFAPPFEFQTTLMAETNVHTLAIPARPPPIAGGAGQMPVGGPPSPGVPLTIGQPVLLVVGARALRDCRLQLLDASVELVPDSGLQLLNDMKTQVDPSGAPLTLGDLQTLLIHVFPTKIATTYSMGTLSLRFQRLPEPLPTQPPSETIPPPSQPEPPTPSSDPSSKPSSSPPSPETQPSPNYLEELVIPFPLPPAYTQDGILTIRSATPPHATVGMAFTFSIQVQNFTTVSQELQVTVTDSQGFSCEGEKAQVLTVPPKENNSVTWLLTARALGQLPLPTVKVIATRYNCQVMCQRAFVYVQAF